MSQVLSDYVDVNNHKQSNALKNILKTPAQPFVFPLTDADKEIIKTLERQFDAEENCGGLAAPQIGYSKQVIIFAVSEDLRKFRANVIETMGKSIWLNPSYEGATNEKDIDYEACFSMGGTVANVARFRHIKYHAYLPNGDELVGTAKGFLARVIQHEIDHLKGVLYTDIAVPGSIQSLNEFRIKRAKELQEIALMEEEQIKIINDEGVPILD